MLLVAGNRCILALHYMDNQQRLVICFDGTWNNEDNSTNVLHQFNLVRKGDFQEDGKTITQRKYYHRGVGTGPLDRITGGGFGFGLEQNVRDAYDWLVGHYRDGRDGVPADEIYVFGFSRGAFTARSLVGFIGRLGLLRRAAPLTVSEMWSSYLIIERERHERKPASERPQMRELSALVWDPGLVRPDEKHDPDTVPGQRVEDLNQAEQLLVRWSRRVKITYLGIYDTVGAMGWDALAFPLLKSRLATHHNMRPTTIIQHCRHALAIDEHRSSFNHTPFIAFVGQSKEEQARLEADSQQIGSPAGSDPRDEVMQKWAEKIEQKWFVGAHSNIGGGYDDNLLAVKPLEWVYEGAGRQGLQGEELPRISLPGRPALPPPTDSYREFSFPIWTWILRAKRNYRVIGPDPEPRASIAGSHGFTLESINESIDDSVCDYYERGSSAIAPNLIEYARRNPGADPKNIICGTEPHHPWIGERLAAYTALVLWASFAAIGGVALHKLIWNADPPTGVPVALAFLFVLVDWGESRANFAAALGKSQTHLPRWKAFLDSIYWTRALGVVYFFFGVIYGVIYLWQLGWGPGAWEGIKGEAATYHWILPYLAGAAIVVVNLLERSSPARRKSGWLSIPLGALVGYGASLAIVIASRSVHFLLPGLGPIEKTPAATEPFTAALLLLLEFGFIYFALAFEWVGDPMNKANLGSITPLQKSATSAAVAACLEKWRVKLSSDASEEAVNGRAARKMRAVVREALWRDIFGFIPIYTLVGCFGLWFAADKLKWPFLSASWSFSAWPISFWLVPLIAFAADYLEDICHLYFVRGHAQGNPPAGIVPLFSISMSAIKFVAFGIEAPLALAALILGAWKVAHELGAEGWRGTVALLIPAAFGVAILILLLMWTWDKVKPSKNPNPRPLKAS
jgi:uncharacterized protein (DUF2235 family)